MPRTSRLKSESGIYHIIMRGINRETIFFDEEDCTKFIQTLQKYKVDCGYKMYAFCLMGNHLHLLLQESNEPLETVMRRICGSFVFWYNKKYDRIGYLFQDRYKSEPVEDDTYFLVVLRYIFQNPVKAGIVDKIENYKWTNYNDYIGINNRTDIDFVFSFFDEMDKENALKIFIEYVNKENGDECMDMHEKKQPTDYEAMKIIKTCCKIENERELQKIGKDERDIYLRVLMKKHNLSIRQIERLTGIGRGIIQNL
ncbi:MAG: transposase [Tissierellia bacterium]|nr:transposase [Tissierellia bacterium]